MKKMTYNQKDYILECLEAGEHYLSDGVYCVYSFLEHTSFRFVFNKKLKKGDWYSLTKSELDKHDKYMIDNDISKHDLPGYYEFWKTEQESELSKYYADFIKELAEKGRARLAQQNN